MIALRNGWYLLGKSQVVKVFVLPCWNTRLGPNRVTGSVNRSQCVNVTLLIEGIKWTNPSYLDEQTLREIIELVASVRLSVNSLVAEPFDLRYLAWGLTLTLAGQGRRSRSRSNAKNYVWHHCYLALRSKSKVGCVEVDVRGSALPSVAKSKKESLSASVRYLSACRIITQMRSIGF